MDSRKLEQLEKGINIVAFLIAAIAIIATIAGCLNYAVLTQQKFYIFASFISAVVSAVLLFCTGRNIMEK